MGPVCSAINTAIGYAAWRLKLETPDVQASSPFVRRIGVWRDCGLSIFPTEKDRLDSLRGRATNLHDNRNAIIHGYLAVPFPDPKDPSALSAVQSFIWQPPRPKLRGLTADAIETEVHKVGWLYRDLAQFHGEVDWFQMFNVQANSGPGAGSV
jgi:hypothetical protein